MPTEIEKQEIEKVAWELYQAAGRPDGFSSQHLEQARIIVQSRNDDFQPTGGTSGEHQYLILVRHARRSFSAIPEQKQRMDGWDVGKVPSDAPDTGWRKTLNIAIALAERLEIEGVCVSHILHSSHEVARQTALTYASVLCRRGPSVVQEASWLSPEDFRKLKPTELSSNLTSLRKMGMTVGNAPRAIVLVGHQPQLSQIANLELSRSRWLRSVWRRTSPLPLGGSEAAGLQVEPRPLLRWVLSERKGDLVSEVKDKIKSKYEVAKFFLGALTINSGVLLNGKVWELLSPNGSLSCAGYLALLLLALGLSLSVATLLAYDKLNMPPHFWSEVSDIGGPESPLTLRPPRGSVLRPPSDATMVLFFEMMNVWLRFFVPALFSSLGAVGLILYARLSPTTSCFPSQLPILDALPPGLMAAAPLLIIFLSVVLWYRLASPRLGVQD